MKRIIIMSLIIFFSSILQGAVDKIDFYRSCKSKGLYAIDLLTIECKIKETGK